MKMPPVLTAALLSPALALALMAASATAARADRAPTAEERSKIEQVLRAEGFTAWEEIELDDGKVWEVDDARAADGKTYDLKLDQGLKIVERKPD